MEWSDTTIDAALRILYIAVYTQCTHNVHMCMQLYGQRLITIILHIFLVDSQMIEDRKGAISQLWLLPGKPLTSDPWLWKWPERYTPLIETLWMGKNEFR